MIITVQNVIAYVFSTLSGARIRFFWLKNIFLIFLKKKWVEKKNAWETYFFLRQNIIRDQKFI